MMVPNMYDAGEHTGVWGHSSRCKACDARWEAADFRTTYAERLTRRRRPNRDDMIGRDVIATTAYGYNNAGGGRFRANGVRGQVWSAADPTMIGSRKERAYWIADGSHYYAAAESDLIDQCWMGTQPLTQERLHELISMTIHEINETA